MYDMACKLGDLGLVRGMMLVYGGGVDLSDFRLAWRTPETICIRFTHNGRCRRYKGRWWTG